MVGIKVDEFNSATLLIAFMWSIVLTLNLVATHYEPKATSRIGIIDRLALRRSLRFFHYKKFGNMLQQFSDDIFVSRRNSDGTYRYET